MCSEKPGQLQHRVGGEIIKLGVNNYRSFPWRFTYDPYLVAVSEILLRRTKAVQVGMVYNQIIERYPSVQKMVNIRDDDVMLSSLGLHSRARILRKFAGQIVDIYDGIIPEERKKLLAITGLGDYSTSAIRVFAFRHIDPLIDANTVRIISRINGIPFSDSLRRSKIIHKKYEEIAKLYDPVVFGYSILDFGALICGTVPVCGICSLNSVCQYAINHTNK
ncbi:MAG: hypothetical protein RE471_06070 [Ferroplasma sp.]|uniref:hypothetical protein n=1 Tax=Ferroplasma sp. TaxID=2591003 RepID=UPI0028161050|nr:hypothetical protein [Ferroplasma sp.]WMT50547.1 MAG: hypothetical protein RE471_06070 [Ferroplasma sp.]